MSQQTYCGVHLDLIDENLLTQEMARCNINVDDDATLKRKIDVFASWVERNVDDIARCDTCGGVSDGTKSQCPFCGEVSENVSTAIVVANSTSVVHEAELVYSETDLNIEVQKTLQLKANVVAGHWHLGKQLYAMYTSKIWNARLDENGVPLYKNFETFCRNELQMSDTNAYALMEIARNFPEEMVAQIGTWKLGLILKAPKDIQEKLIERAKSGDSLRSIQHLVKTARDASGMTRVRKTKDAPVPAPKAEREIITMVEIEGAKEIPFYTTESVKNKKYQAATTADGAVGFHYLVNDVVLSIKLSTNAKGELVGTLNISRV